MSDFSRSPTSPYTGKGMKRVYKTSLNGIMQQRQKKVEPLYHHIAILCNISSDFTGLLTDMYIDTCQQITLNIYTLNPLLVTSRQNSFP